MLLPSLLLLPPHYPAHTQKKSRRALTQAERSPTSQSALCTLALSSRLDIEEGSAALLLLLLLLPLQLSPFSICARARVCVCVYVCVCARVWKPDEMKYQDWATSRESLSIL